MKKRCEKGKPCGATCIERDKDCLVDAGGSISQSLKSVRGTIQQSTKLKIAASAEPSARKPQLHAKRVLTALKSASGTDNIDGVAKENEVKWSAVLKSDVFGVGGGSFGSFLTLPTDLLIPNGDYGGKLPYEVGAKFGKIGVNEVQALKLAGENDIGPRLVAAKVSKDVGTKYKFEVSDGAIAMTKVPGQTYYNSKENKGAKSEMLWEAMARLHNLGIAHNDLYGQNVIIDPSSGKARIIDFGLAQMSYKAALAEGLGTLSGTNFQFVGEKNYGHSWTAKANLPYIEQLLMDKGLSNYEISSVLEGGIRKGSKFYGKGGWGKLSEDDAKELVQALYAGIAEFD